MAQVKYKGKVIADISKGQKLTLRVDGHELEGDIVIDGFNGGGSSGGSALPIEISTESEMNALLSTAEVGSIYKYRGTTGTYENGALYVVEVAE